MQMATKEAEAKLEAGDRTIYPFPGKKTKLKVWNFFGFHKIKEGPPTKENLDMAVAVCRVCGKKYANKGNFLRGKFRWRYDGHKHVLSNL